MKFGDFVRCNFPFREVAGPGPSPHIVLCIGTGRIADLAFVVVAYTTSRVSFEGARRPRQQLYVDRAQATLLGQKPFVIDASRVARLPIASAYFPDIQHGSVPISGHDIHLARAVID
jgi:hypothetical protein